MTFAQYLDYFLSHPSYQRKAAHLLSDEQYVSLLELCMGTQTVTEYCEEKKVSKSMKKWLFKARQLHTYKYVVMEYTPEDISKMDKGPVLACFVQPDPLAVQGQTFVPRPPTATTALTVGTMRRCVPVSQLVDALAYCHGGPLLVMHYGQDTTEKRANKEFYGITRTLSRLFVTLCRHCQQKQPRQHKAKLVPILAKHVFERIVIDLIDYSRKPSNGYKWILHACDHFSKFHWAFAMLNKESATVAHHLEMLFQQTGPVKIIQSDNGTEFLGEVGWLLSSWGMAGVVNGSPYHPQTQGIVERYNRALKGSLDSWMVQESSQDWYLPLSRIVYQLNCTAPRTTRQIPYELVHAMQPPSWTGLRWQGLLSEENLCAVFAACVTIEDATGDSNMDVDTAAEELTVLSPAASAINTLTSMAAGQQQTSATASSTLVPISRPPVQDSRPPVRDSLPPILETRPAAETLTNAMDWRGRPLIHPLRPLPNMPPSDNITDLQHGRLGPLNTAMAALLNVGGLQFYRFGVDGGGRCALSTFLTATGSAMVDRPLAVRRAHCDARRVKLREEWESYNQPARAAQKKKMRELVYDAANSGRDHNRQPNIDPTLVYKSEEWFEAMREEAWKELGEDFVNPARSLGWDALVWLGTHSQINIILFANFTLHQSAQAGTKLAIARWKQNGATTDAQAKRRAWQGSEQASDPVLLPSNRVHDSWSFVVLYHRTELTYRYRKPEKADDPDVMTTEGGSGHYEPIVTGVTTPNSYTDVVGLFTPTQHPAEHAQLLAIAKRLAAAVNNAASTERMAQDHDASSKVHEFKYLDAVAVRIQGKKPRSGDTSTSLPGLVIGVHRHDKGSRTQKVVHQTYTVWCEYGVLDNTLPVDKLNKLSLNNFPELLDFIHNTLTDTERLPTDDPNWSSPNDRITTASKKISLKNAWAKHLVQRKQRPEDQSRHRTTASRAAASAADTAIAAIQADRRSALSLNTVTNQPASQPARGASPSRIVRITGHTLLKYKVTYSQPAANPETGTVNRKWLDTHDSYVQLVLAYWDDQRTDSAEEAAFAPSQRRNKLRSRIAVAEEEEEQQDEEADEEADEEGEQQHEANAEAEEAADEMEEDEEPANNDVGMEEHEE